MRRSRTNPKPKDGLPVGSAGICKTGLLGATTVRVLVGNGVAMVFSHVDEVVVTWAITGNRLAVEM